MCIFDDLEPTKKCTKCDIVKPVTEFYKMKGGKDGLRAQCKDCCNAKRRQHRKDNPELHLERDRERYKIRGPLEIQKRAEDPEFYRARDRQIYANNKDHYRKRGLEKYYKHKDTLLANRKQKRYENLEERRERDRLFYHEHKNDEKYIQRRLETREHRLIYWREWAQRPAVKAIRRLRVAIRRQQIADTDDGSITDATLDELRYVKFSNRCAYCFDILDSIVHLEHIVSLSKGGKHIISNVVYTCGPCNLSKGTKDLIEWLDMPHLFN